MPRAPDRAGLWVVDRFEGELAVVQAGPDRFLDIPRWLLPSGAREGDWIAVSVFAEGEDGCRVELQLDADATRRARDQAAARLDMLRAGDPGGDLEL